MVPVARVSYGAAAVAVVAVGFGLLVSPAEGAAYYVQLTCADLSQTTYQTTSCFPDNPLSASNNNNAGWALGGGFGDNGIISFAPVTTTTTTTTKGADAVVTCSDSDGATSTATTAFALCDAGLEKDPWPATPCDADPCTVAECCYVDNDAKVAAARALLSPCQQLIPADDESQLICSIFGLLNEQCCTCENAGTVTQSGTGARGYFESNCTVETVQEEIADTDETGFTADVGGVTGGGCLSCCKSYNGTATNGEGFASPVSICTHRVCGGVCTDQRTPVDIIEIVATPECTVDNTAQTIVTVVLVLIIVYYFGAAIFMMTTYEKPTQIHLE